MKVTRTIPGVATAAAAGLVFVSSLLAAGLIRLLATDPESLLAVLATSENLWDLVAGLTSRLIAII
jgi:hypothetical protein